MTVPAELAVLLESWPQPDRDEQAFPFVTVDDQGFPHVMLLCTAELLPTADHTALLVAIVSQNARANLARTGVATLIAADGTAAHYLKLRLHESADRDGFTCFTFHVTHHKRDSLGIPLHPMNFRATKQVAESERWTRTRAALTELRDSRPSEMEGLPDDLPIVYRTAVRLIVLDERDQLLLFHTWSPEYPERGKWWELPGGGIEPGETYLDAAIRELREETGFTVDATRIGPPDWRRRAAFKLKGVRRVQDEVVATVRLDGTAPVLDVSEQTSYERVSYLTARWWPVADLVATRERCYPGRLAELLPAFLAGELIDERFELWS